MNYLPILLIPIFLSSAWAEEPKCIPASSIGHDFIFTGIGNIPLGQIFVVEGKGVSEPDRDYPKDGRTGTLLIISVNGKNLEKPTKAMVGSGYSFPANVIFRLRVVEDAIYELAFTPNLSVDLAAKDEGKQKLTTFLRIVEQLSPETPKLYNLPYR